MKSSFVRSSIVKRWLRDVKADQPPGWASTPPIPTFPRTGEGTFTYPCQPARGEEDSQATCRCTHEGQRALISELQHPYIWLEDVGRPMYDAQFAWSRAYGSNAY
jgi:hypothetical protein